MRIVEYNKAIDIVVEFQDEYKEKVHTSYYRFTLGEVENPHNKIVQHKDERLGQAGYNNDNELMKIVEYNKASDVVVEFQDKNKYKVRTTYDHFLKGGS